MPSYALPSTKAPAKTTSGNPIGPNISTRDYLQDFQETWNEATHCTLCAPVDEPDGGWVQRLNKALDAYDRLSERLSRGFDWLHDHDETDPAWAKNQALYDRLHWQRELVWQRIVGGSNELSIAVWRLWVDYSHLTPEQQQLSTEFDDVEIPRAKSPQDIWDYLMPERTYTGEWPPNPSEGWHNVMPRGGKKDD